MTYYIEPRTRKCLNRYEFLSFGRNISNKYGKQLLSTRLNALKTSSKKVIHKAAGATREFIGNTIADKIVKSDVNLRNVEGIIILQKREKKY